MSIRVMSAVWGISLPDSEKLVLLALADCANDEGGCWPSMRTLADKCSKSDRTVQAAIKALVDKGHLTRVEKPGKGCDYIVHPVADHGMEGYHPPQIHYVYRTTNLDTGEFYVGARSCYVEPEADKYLGSGEWVKASRKAGANLAKAIIETYPSREALAVGEAAHTAAVVGHPLCKNRKVASARCLSPFGGLSPEAASPRREFAPKGTTPTPEAASDKPLRTTIPTPVSSDEETAPAAKNGKAVATIPQLEEAWNTIAVPAGAVECRRMGPERRRKAGPFLKRYPIEDITEAIHAVANSDFLCGRGKDHFRADIEFLFSPKHMNRLLEGFYAR